MNPPPSADPPLVIGLLGGIAAGKSTVSRFFAEHGFRVLNADLVARHVVRQPACRARIRDRFGPGILAAAGGLRRELLAELVFSDPTARHDLEEIIHPEVRTIMLRDLAAARAAGESVVLDVPLLLERGLVEECDYVVFLEADLATRQARAVARGWKPGELERREAAQAPLDIKRARSQFTVHTDRALGDTRDEVADVLRQIEATDREGEAGDRQ